MKKQKKQKFNRNCLLNKKCVINRKFLSYQMLHPLRGNLLVVEQIYIYYPIIFENKNTSNKKSLTVLPSIGHLSKLYT